MHADMDAFFASVEVKEKPWLKGKPVAVCGDISRRSVIATASYEARKYNVCSAMPVFKALKLCPNLILIKADHEKYEKVSRKIIKIFSAYSPVVETCSIDEAFIDFTYRVNNFDEAAKIAENIKNDIYGNLGLTLTIGISSNKFLAKLASGIGKPDGIKIILPKEKEFYLKNIPVKKVSGIGSKTAELLKNRFNVDTLGELKKIPLLTLSSVFKSYAVFLYNAARGTDESPVVPDYEKKHAKSISNSITLPFDTDNVPYINNVLKHLSHRVAIRLRNSGVYARSIILTVRYSDFRTTTRRTNMNPVNTSKSIYLATVSLLRETDLNKKIRLLGITASNLTNLPVIRLFDNLDKREELIERTMDKLRARYGKNLINYATFIKPHKKI